MNTQKLIINVLKMLIKVSKSLISFQLHIDDTDKCPKASDQSSLDGGTPTPSHLLNDPPLSLLTITPKKSQEEHKHSSWLPS